MARKDYLGWQSVVEVGGCLEAFICSFFWVWRLPFTSTLEMAEKEFRILPITMSTIFWIMYVLWHGSGTRMAWYTITSLQQGTNDLVRSVLCCSSLGVVCLKVAWEISRATSILLEQEVWWIYIQYLKIVWFVLALGMCAPLGYIVWKDWQKFKEARESWKQHQRLSQAESGAEEKSN